MLCHSTVQHHSRDLTDSHNQCLNKREIDTECIYRLYRLFLAMYCIIFQVSAAGKIGHSDNYVTALVNNSEKFKPSPQLSPVVPAGHTQLLSPSTVYGLGQLSTKVDSW